MSILALKIINVILILEILILFGSLLYLNYKRYKKQMEVETWAKKLSEKNRAETDKEK